MNGPKEFWMVDLQGNFWITGINIWPRTDCCQDHIVGSTVQVLDKTGDVKWSAPITSVGGPFHLEVPKGIAGSFVRVLNKPNQYLNMAELEVFSGGGASVGAPSPVAQVKPLVNIALRKPATQSSTGWGGVASRVNDGNTDGNMQNSSVNHTMNGLNEFWMVDLQGNFAIEGIKIWGRTDCCGSRLVGSTVQVLDKAGQVKWSAKITSLNQVYEFAVPKGIVGASVRVLSRPSGEYLNIAEVQVFGVADEALK